MRIEFAARRRRGPSLTSLIDVIFLLLLFFMLSSTFTRFAEVDISGGSASAGPAAKTPDVLLRLDGEGWSVNGLALSSEDAVAELGRLESEGAASIVLLVRGEVTSQELIEAVEIIRRETDLTVSVAR